MSGGGINEFFWEAAEGQTFGEESNNLAPLSFNRQLELEAQSILPAAALQANTREVESSSWRRAPFP